MVALVVNIDQLAAGIVVEPLGKVSGSFLYVSHSTVTAGQC